MRFSYRWLRDYLLVKKSLPEILEGFTMAGLEVETVADMGALSGKILIGQVMKIAPHPQSDTLVLCAVNTGKERLLSIVCGAKNMKEGDKVAVALEGAELQGGITIQHTRIRGEVSEGMLCAGDELGLNNDHSGILILPKDFPIGEPLDAIIEISVTPNRGDCLSVIGLARDLSGYFQKRFPQPAIRITETMDRIENYLKVSVQNREACPRYGARYIRGTRVGSSPAWLVYRLESAGLRPLNNVIDVTNYVMMEYGHPIHAFDLDRVSNRHIIVRNALPEEKIETLDGEQIPLLAEDLVIADAGKPIALAGIMGGVNSGISHSTINVVLECAYFDPITIRRTRSRMGKQTEASFRFERNMDIEAIPRVLDRAASLIQQLAGGEIVQGILDVKNYRSSKKIVSLSVDKTNNLLGVTLGAREIADLLAGLNFEIVSSNPQELLFSIPSYRNDIVREIDLVEEVARMYGYQKIKPTLPYIPSRPVSPSSLARIAQIIKKTLYSLMLEETITYSFTSSKLTEALGLSLTKAVKLANPISSDQDMMRTSLLPGFIETVAHNLNRDVMNLRLYEMGKVFHQEENNPSEEVRLIAGICGDKFTSWIQKASPVDFYDIKGIAGVLAASLGFSDMVLKPLTGINYYHPTRAACFIKDGEEICRFGELHPLLTECLDLKKRLYILEMNLTRIAPQVRKEICYRPIPKYPSITRDLAIVLDESVPCQDVEDAIRKTAGSELESLNLFDLYRGDPVPEGKKSLAYTLVFQATDRTLTDEEVGNVLETIVNELKQKYNAVLR